MPLYLKALLPSGIMAMENGPIQTTLENAKEESEEIIYTVVEDLLNKLNIDPKEVICF